MLILGTTSIGLMFVGDVESWSRPALDGADLSEIKKDANGFVVVRAPVLHLEIPDERTHSIKTGLRSVCMTVEIDEWHVKLAAYVKLEEKQHKLVLSRYREFIQKERAARSGIEVVNKIPEV